MRPHLKSGRRGFLCRKWPDPRGGSLAALPGMGSHPAGPHGSLEWAPADSPHVGRVRLELPRPLLGEWKRRPENTQKRSLPSQRLALTGGAGGRSFLPQGRRGRFGFLLRPHTPLPYPPELGRRPLFSSVHGPLEPVGDGVHEGTGSSHNRSEGPSSLRGNRSPGNLLQLEALRALSHLKSSCNLGNERTQGLQVVSS